MTLKRAVLKADLDGTIVPVAPITVADNVYLADEKTTLTTELERISQEAGKPAVIEEITDEEINRLFE